MFRSSMRPALSCALLVALLLVGCDANNVQPNAPERVGGGWDIYSLPVLGEAYAITYLAQGYQETTFEDLGDSASIVRGPNLRAQAYFGNNDTVGSIAANGTALAKTTFAPYGSHYYVDGPPLYFNGNPNIVAVTDDGVAFTDTIAANLGTMTFTPNLKDSVSRASGFTVNWSTTGVTDYIVIALTEVVDSTSGTFTAATKTFIVEDDGSETIGSAHLSGFDSRVMMITVSRIAYVTKTHNSRDYRYALVATRAKDVYMKP